MTTAVQMPVQLKQETLEKIRVRSATCDICRSILGSLKEDAVLSERGGIAIEAQKRHIKAELTAISPQSAALPAPTIQPPPKSKDTAKDEKVSAWPDSLKDSTVERLKVRIPKDDDSPGCQLCKWIVEALTPSNVMRNHPVKDDHKLFPVKSQKLHLALEFGETEP